MHRAARIAAAGHGGQVVVSDATANLVARLLPPGVSLRDLGWHRLRDLNLPEHLYQILIPGGQSEFPPLKSVGTISSLPVATTPLLGRRSEVAALAALLLERELRLVTLTGPGGSGKTRLAVAAAREAVEGFPDGVYFVSLAAVTAADVMWNSIGEALDVPVGERTPPALFGYVAGRRALVLLDNLEQLQGVDTAVATLLREAPDLVVLATSRRPLHLTSEHQYAVAPLALPDADTLASAGASPAVQLYVERARAVRSSFALTAENSSDVSAICRRLDGLPLAIELAAARSKLLGPRALLARLGPALDLHGSDVDRPSRQQALRETIGWSYRLLPAPQRAVFRRLGVFAGGTDLDAVAAVCADATLGVSDPVDLVEDLVDASLVTVTEGYEGEPRFGMLETVRAFALDALAETGDLEDAHRVHAAHFARVAAPLDVRLTWATRDHVIRGNRLFELEWDNFREALAWATSAPGQLGPGERRELGLALMARLWGWWCDFDLAESRHWLEAVLNVAGSNESVDFGACLYAYSIALMQQGEPSKARLVAQRSVAVLRTLDAKEMAYALLYLSEVEAALADFHACRQSCQEALALARDLGDGFLLGKALDDLGYLEWDEENWPAALRQFRKAKQAYLRGGWDYLPITEHRIACVLRKLGQVHEAHQLMSAGFQHEARTYRPKFLLLMGEDYAAALADAGFAGFTPLVLGACDAARHRVGLRPDQREERVIAEARTTAESALTGIEWADAYARGQSMTILDALAEAVSSTTDLRI